MPVLQSLDRAGIRLSVLYNLNAVFEGSTTTISSGATDIIDSKLRAGVNDLAGQWVIITDGSLAGQIARVASNTATPVTLTTAPAFTGTPASGVSYLLMGDEFRPQFVHNVINQSIHYVTGKAYDPEEEFLHLDNSERRYAIPSVFNGISKLERRISYGSTSIDPCENGWTQQTGVTQSFNQMDRRNGSASLQLVAVSVSVANIAVKTISSLDISKYDYIEFWWKSSIAITTAGHITFALTSSTATVTLNMPAAEADTWTYMRIALTSDQARQLSDVVTLTFAQGTNLADATFWIDDIKAVENSTAKWERIHTSMWSIDKEAREIVFQPDYGTVPYQLMKITGGGIPVLLDADATVSEVDPMFMIAKSTELLLLSTSGGPNIDPEARRSLAGYWSGIANERIRALPARQNWREVD
jgi:hypothetical protein